MMELKQVKEEVQSIIGGHANSIRNMFNVHNEKVLKAKQGVDIGKYQPLYYKKVLEDANKDMKNMYKGYRESLLNDLNEYKKDLDRKVRLPKNIDYNKASYDLQYLKSFEVNPEDKAQVELYNEEVKKVCLNEPYLASNILNVVNVSLDTKHNIQQRVDILLGADITTYIEEVIQEVSSTIASQREEEGIYTIKYDIALDTPNKQEQTFELLSF